MRMVASPFALASYVEVKEGRPYRAKIGKVWYSTRYQSAVSWVRFMAIKEQTLKFMSDAAKKDGGPVEQAQKQLALVQGLRVMILLLWEIRERKGFLGELWRIVRFDKVRFHRFMFNNVDKLFEVFEQVMAYNGRLLRWNAIPRGMESDSRSSVGRDWFRDFTEGFDPTTTPWIEICHAREQSKIKSIGEWEAQQRHEAKMKQMRGSRGR